MNGFQYKKIYRRNIHSREVSTWGTNETHFLDTFIYVGRIRTEDNNRVYFADDRNGVSSPYVQGTDNLIYYFSDTLYGIISKIDTVTINSGHKIKKYEIGNIASQYFYEGIGSVYGFFGSKLLNWGPGRQYQNEMLCYESGNMFFKSNAKDYNNLLNWYFIENCYNINLLNTQAINLPSDLTVSPNPSNGIFLIKGRTQSEHTFITIYNNFGQKVFDKTIRGYDINTEVQLNNSVPGIYTISIRSGDIVKHEKLIIQ